MALVDDIRNEIAELIDSGDEIRGHAQAFIQQAGMDADAAESRGRAEAVVQRMDELLTALRGVDFAKASVESVSALIGDSELALDQADEVLDELGL